MFTANLDIQKILAGGVLNEPGTKLFKAYTDMLCTMDTMPGSTNVYTHDVFDKATDRLRELGEGRLADEVHTANTIAKSTMYAAMSAFAANMIAAEAKMAGRSSAEAFLVIVALQND